MFLLPSYQKSHHNIAVSVIRESPIKYMPSIFLFLLPFLSDIPQIYYCFCCLPYQIKIQIISLTVACSIRYIHTTLLILLPVLSDLNPRYYSFC